MKSHLVRKITVKLEDNDDVDFADFLLLEKNLREYLA